MIKSMTGYGRARELLNKRDITVEVRSVNNRYLDCTVKMPRMYALRRTLSSSAYSGQFPGGRWMCSLRWMPPRRMLRKVTVNRELAAQYAAALRRACRSSAAYSRITVSRRSSYPGFRMY